MHRLLAAVLAVATNGCGHSSGIADEGVDATDGGNAAPGTTAACVGKPAVSGDTTWTVMSSGVARTVDVHIPATYDPASHTPIVLNFHGYTQDGTQEETLSEMDPSADAAGYVVLYPVGTGALPSWNAGACCGTAVTSNVDDVQFVRDIIDTASTQLCVDPKRIYATGMSNGGFFAHRLGCELADRIAAIAPVAGVDGIPTCTPSRPMPVMHFHGDADPFVPYDGSPTLGFISVPDTFSGWAGRDGCTGSPTQTYSNGDATCSTYALCADGAEVTLCTIDGGGHTWPGGTPVPEGGLTSTDISATAAMWTFFAAHPMP